MVQKLLHRIAEETQITAEEFDNALSEMMLERARKSHEAGRLGDAIDYSIQATGRYPGNAKARNEFGCYLREYIMRNHGMPDEKVIKIYESKLIPIEFNFTVYRLFIIYPSTLTSAKFPLQIIKATNNLLIDTTTIYITYQGEESLNAHLTGPSKVLFSSKNIIDYVMNNVDYNKPLLPAYAALRIPIKPTEYKFYIGENKTHLITCNEEKERIVIEADKSVSIELIKIDTGAEIPPINRTQKQVEYWLGEETDNQTKVA